MTKAKAFIGIALLLALYVFFAPRSNAQGGVPELIQRAAANQDQSLGARDRSRYEQSIHVEKVNPSSRPGEPQRIESTQDTVVLVEPSKTPDNTAPYPLNLPLIPDTNAKP